MTAATPHLRAILIAGALAATAVALGFYTIARQQLSAPPPVAVAPHHATGFAKPSRLNANEAAARAAGLPNPVAAQFARHDVVVVALYAPSVAVDRVAAGEARAGASLGGAGFVAVDVAHGRAADKLSAAYGVLAAPATLVLARGSYGAPVTMLDGFADRETVAQAARSADPSPGGSTSRWSRRANALCTRSSARFAALGPISTRAELRRALPRARALGKTLVAGLAAAKAPVGQRAAVRQLLGFVRADLAQSLRLATATVARDGATIADATAKQAVASAHVNGLATTLGAPSCASPF